MSNGKHYIQEDQNTPLLSTREAARFLNVSPRTLESWRVKGGGPIYLEISSRLIRYEKSELLRWLADQRRRSTCDDGSWLQELERLRSEVSG